MTPFDSIGELGDNVIGSIAQQANGDYPGYFREKATELLLPMINDDNMGQIGQFIQETPQIIISHQDIEVLQGECFKSVMLLLGECSGNIDFSCIQGGQLLSNGVFSRDLDALSTEKALNLSYISHQDNLKNASFRVRVTTKQDQRKNMMFPYGEKQDPRWKALKKALKGREALLREKGENVEKKNSKTPNLKICRGLVKKGVLIEHEAGKFKMKSMSVRGSPYIGSSEWLYLRVGNKEHGRSLDKHTFSEAYYQLVIGFKEELGVTELEIGEIMKCCNKFLYK